VLVEPIISDGGLVIPPPGFLPGVRVLCDEHGALLLVDEVKVGMGRTGMLCAVEHEQVVPDIITLGKSLGSGLPLSAVVAPRSVLNAETATSLLTLAGNPVSAAAGLAVLDLLTQTDLLAQVTQRGDTLGSLLDGLRREHSLVHDVRHRGLVAGIEFRLPDGSPAGAQTRKIVFRAWELGAAMIYVGPHGNVIEFTPPLVITDEQLATAVGCISQAIIDVEAGLVSDEAVAPFTGW
jgi:4-aminobutyrate aminotransferase